ncbi:uncharacterized protein [Anser cygnoides]|uniref:uncharacterized protein isoform X3 n=1 Tax=Anser cygnoides TaxID=8845 RepID=UPI0034D24166
MALALALLPLLLLPWGSGTLGYPESQVVLVTEGEPVVMECPFRKHTGSGDPFYELIWSHRNMSGRILQFRMTRSNASCAHRSEGHFSGTVDFERSVSFLNISEVLMNDTGPYLCYVKIGSSNPTEKVTHLLVRGRQPWAASGGLSFSVPQGGEVTLDCDFPANLTRNFTNLFWLHEQDQSPPRLVAWHLTSSFQNDSGSIGSRFQSIFDLENHRSRLTITGLEEEDGGWYHCEGLGELSGRQRGTRTNLAVKDKHHIQLRRRRTLQDASGPCCRPAEEGVRQPAGREAVSVSAGSMAEYSVSAVPGRAQPLLTPAAVQGLATEP